LHSFLDSFLCLRTKDQDVSARLSAKFSRKLLQTFCIIFLLWRGQCRHYHHLCSLPQNVFFSLRGPFSKNLHEPEFGVKCHFRRTGRHRHEIFAVFYSSYQQGPNKGGKGGTIPRVSNHCGRAPKSLNNVTSTFFNTIHMLPKELRFEHGSAQLASCPGRHVTSLCPCLFLAVIQSTTVTFLTIMQSTIIYPCTPEKQTGSRKKMR